ncbi:DUF2487 family protein [Oceanobacillus sp. FSL W8-0428]|uniref:DUF2487 domain-containing protein n=1 Tax=Oceanobacillus sojae TaxID=582851 RepID=A0A511ZD35_9BACI|nr:DUF2487 family protein [Oceanobacillus sojae]GEN85357.1 hypothetical protein OSO01_00960 [Oceanobacillus sojae]
MKWTSVDLQKYDQAKEYIDTIIVPLAPFQIGALEASAKNADQYDVLTLFARELEKELMGRIMLTPIYTYITSAEKLQEAERINEWTNHFKEQPFKQVLYISFDPSWRKIANDLEGEFIWLPTASLKDADPAAVKGIIRDQTLQTVELIKSFW